MALDNRRSYANTTNYTNGVFCFHSVPVNRRGTGDGAENQTGDDGLASSPRLSVLQLQREKTALTWKKTALYWKK